MDSRFSDLAEDFNLVGEKNEPENDEEFVRKLNEEFGKFSAKAKSLQELYKMQLLALIQEHSRLISDVLQQLCKDMFGKTAEECEDFTEPLLRQALSLPLKISQLICLIFTFLRAFYLQLRGISNVNLSHTTFTT